MFVALFLDGLHHFIVALALSGPLFYHITDTSTAHGFDNMTHWGRGGGGGGREEQEMGEGKGRRGGGKRRGGGEERERVR